MTRHRFPTLLAAALAVAFVGAAAAQTQSNDTSRMPANKGMPQETQAQPSYQKTPETKSNEPTTQNEQSSAAAQNGQMGKAEAKTGQWNMQQKEQMKNGNAMAPEASSGHTSRTKQASAGSMKQHHAMHTAAHHAGASKSRSEQATAPEEKAYREALRDCAKEQNGSQRDSCLDDAIERFHKNA